MKMMMNFFMTRRTTTPLCYALLLVLLLVASLAVEVSSVNVKNSMGNTNTMPEDEKDVERKLTGEDDKLPYSRKYIVVTKAVDFIRLFPNGGNIVTYLDDFFVNKKSNPLFPIQGSSTTQKGAVYDLSSIEVVNAPDGVVVQVADIPNVVKLDIQVQFAGNRKIKFTPVDDPFYFLHGQCIVTSGFLEPSAEIATVLDGPTTIPQPVIKSQSCRLNLCLGGGGFSCIAIYSGSAFLFNFGKGVALNNEYKKGETRPLTFEAPPLPPPFPGTIIGGTGAFEGIDGSVSIATIAGTTGPLLFRDSGSGISTGSDPTFGRTKPFGSIVQVILVKSNMPLPIGP